MTSPHDSSLGRSVAYPAHYDPSLLFAIPRAPARAALGLAGDAALPFTGIDRWHAYELGWLDRRGKPVVATATLSVPADSPNLVESKSLKLYLNSLNSTRFDSADALVAQDTPGDPERLDVVIFVVDRHRTLDRPLVIVLNPSWARSDAVISVEADALDASLLERGIRAAERAISSEAFGASEDVLLSVSRLQGPTGEARPAVPSVVRERAQWAADHFVPLIEELPPIDFGRMRHRRQSRSSCRRCAMQNGCGSSASIRIASARS